MTGGQEEMRGYREEGGGAPWRQWIGYAISVLLTFFALWIALSGRAGSAPFLAGLLFLAVLQIGVQLFFFMHVTESQGARFHLPLLTLGIFFAFAVIAGSIWVMTFGGNEAY